jgi:hypothetical protein
MYKPEIGRYNMIVLQSNTERISKLVIALFNSNNRICAVNVEEIHIPGL